jgi:hypothetical protein
MPTPVDTHLSQLQNLRGLWPLVEKDRKQSKDFYQVGGCISRVARSSLPSFLALSQCLSCLLTCPPCAHNDKHVCMLAENTRVAEGVWSTE